MDLLNLSSEEVVQADAAPASRPTSLLRFITCGSVDDGKSTLIGRLLYETGAVFDDQMEALHRDSKKFGTTGGDLDFALLVDGLSAEREQGITIDVAYRYFSTARRAFIIADTPGHEQYTRNMATGASQAELAVILVDARKGILPQTRRHSFITSMLGIKSVIVAVNKMDLVGWDEGVFQSIVDHYRAILPQLAFSNVSFVPLSAKLGDNIAAPSAAMPWYRGKTLLDLLETVTPPALAELEAPFRLPVQWVNRPNLDFRGYSGTVASGGIAPGEKVVVLPSRQTSCVKSIIGPGGNARRAAAGEAVTITLADELDISRGDVIAVEGDRLESARSVEADILWMVDRPVVAGMRFLVRLGTAQSPATLRLLHHAVDIHSFQEKPVDELVMNAIGRATVAFDRPLAAAPYEETRELGSFILIDQVTGETVALGLVRTAVGEVKAEGEGATSLVGGAAPLADAWLGRIPGGAAIRDVVLTRAAAAFVMALASWLLGLAALAAGALGLLDFALRPFLTDAFLRRGAASREPQSLKDGGGI
ncbi:sulfate adenylyltransferase subunit CysN [Consotaella salsifontis]|uniref:Bifunctional enzyme NodQ n=1 Tax=Consotaella salsifontis TaxID=1365950 RepID=A0A1T4SCF8_9HYPH|nr:sulfate adenylyltransferase subunit CysN [Consotaella salsifontis]SKA25865.1 bifunctional enzyme CysN/CysC [Consotaella salsifontis]